VGPGGSARFIEQAGTVLPVVEQKKMARQSQAGPKPAPMIVTS